MAETAPSSNIDPQPPTNIRAIAPSSSKDSVKSPARSMASTNFQKLNQLYALPTPLRTFPLPTFVPHNPVSLFHVLYVWLRQSIKPEYSTFDPLYQGWFSPETRSVHITDERSVRGLWEQGFYGKGSLSRSEPSWMIREKTRRGDKAKATSEEVTAQRRRERQQVKWERARKEREAIDQTLSEEAAAEETSNPEVETSANTERAATEKHGFDLPIANGLGNPPSDEEIFENGSPVIPNGSVKPSPVYSSKSIKPPVGPLELLALPNSIKSFLPANIETLDSRGFDHLDDFIIHTNGKESVGEVTNTPWVDSQTLGHISMFKESIPNGQTVQNSSTRPSSITDYGSINGSASSLSAHGSPNGSALLNGHPTTPKVKRQKSVRFSPTVEKNTFIQSEPPSPEHANITNNMVSPSSSPTTAITASAEEETIKTQEHTQLTLEEAFFLSYALGALAILSPSTGLPIPNKDLFALFRGTAYFPPRESPQLMPDDPFMISYVVYHHYRSLGWVPRPGIKFSCDMMLYHRGPVFDHAEFGVIILPSYSDPYWLSDKSRKAKEQKTWHWLSCINRVISQVKKTLILCYVDIPPPVTTGEEGMRVDEVLARYKIREVVMKRFSANRMRGDGTKPQK